MSQLVAGSWNATDAKKSVTVQVPISKSINAEETCWRSSAHFRFRRLDEQIRIYREKDFTSQLPSSHVNTVHTHTYTHTLSLYNSFYVEKWKWAWNMVNICVEYGKRKEHRNTMPSEAMLCWLKLQHKTKNIRQFYRSSKNAFFLQTQCVRMHASHLSSCGYAWSEALQPISFYEWIWPDCVCFSVSTVTVLLHCLGSLSHILRNAVPCSIQCF